MHLDTKNLHNFKPQKKQKKKSPNFQNEKESDLIRTAATVNQQIRLDTAYLLLLISATIISTLGLLINNSIVVIGSMIIAPLFWPIIGISLGLMISKKKLLQKSFVNCLVSFGLVIFISFVISLLIPKNQNSLMLQNMLQPTILDLFIVLAASIVGITGIVNKKISFSASGVAIAMSLMPPLSACGIALANNNLNLLRGAMLLFGANTTSIILMGNITLYLLKIRPHTPGEKRRYRIGFTLSLIMAFLVSLPLLKHFQMARTNNWLKNQAHLHLKKQLQDISPQAKINDLQIKQNQRRGEQVKIQTQINLPDSTDFSQKNRTQLISTLENNLNRNISLDLEVIKSIRFNDTYLQDHDKIKDNISQIVVNYLFQKKSIDLQPSELQVMINDQNNGQKQIVISLQPENNLKQAIYLNQNQKDDIKQLIYAKYKINHKNIDLELDSPDAQLSSLRTTMLAKNQIVSIAQKLANNMGSVYDIQKVTIHSEQEVSKIVIFVNKNKSASVKNLTFTSQSLETLDSDTKKCLETNNITNLTDSQFKTLLNCLLSNSLATEFDLELRIFEYEVR